VKDPWDVQVIEVIDRYLSELVPAHSAMQVACEQTCLNLARLFLASMLVLFKANTLVELEQREAELEDLSEEVC